MLVIGLTGGIGSGKTLVSDHLAKLGAAIVDTDVIARQVVTKGEPALTQLVDHFGVQILEDNGELDRDRLRQLAFSKEEAKQALDDITHPAIRAQTIEQVKTAEGAYVVIVIPLLNQQSPFLSLFNRIAGVYCEKSIRIERVMQRNNISRQAVETIIDSQIRDDERRHLCHDRIDNSGSIESALRQTEKLHGLYLSLSTETT